MTSSHPAPTSWESILGDLEAQIDAAERLIGHDSIEAWEELSWSAPQVAEPLPALLRDRAEALASRQRQAIAALADVRARAARQQAVTARIGQAVSRGASRPLYIDTSA